MDHVSPAKVVRTMIEAGAAKAAAPVRDLLIRGFLSGALLGISTSLAITTALQTSLPVAGALVFPVGFVMIVLLGLELVTGNFALLPVALADRRCGAGQVIRNLTTVFLANLAGSLFYGALLAVSLTMMGSQAPDAMASKIVAIAQAKTHYLHLGLPGFVAMFVRAVLCNWMVCLGVVMAMTSTSTVGKIVAAWLPVLTFFAHGYEHAVVNMFVIPAGMLLGAPVSMADWWMGNQIPVTLGNLVGGSLFTGLFLYWTYRPREGEAQGKGEARAASRREREERGDDAVKGHGELDPPRPRSTTAA
ncbi:formate/nitrite transporter family protein [Sorangium sp. So ce1036]|uniref:formate/nitrite transporter family protein n=1 Tax=Sorangium sp. So ce1036 TaxID=3133328 RepID=UPI003F094F55